MLNSRVKNFKIVTLGGGTGHMRLLEALKKIPDIQTTSVVAMSDNGGSSGRLRNEFGIFPPGDLRNCLTAFIENETLKKTFQFKFNGEEAKDQEVGGHVFGNILIAALEKIFEGKSIEALMWLHDFLGIDPRFRVLPVTLTKVHFRAEYANGEVIVGEEHMGKLAPALPLPIKTVSLLPDEARVCEISANALDEADVIIIAPGSVYTSTAAVLLPKGIAECLKKSRAKKIYVCNIMTQPGETSGPGLGGEKIIFKASDYVKTIQEYAKTEFDVIICNNKKPPEDVLQTYERFGSFFVECDLVNEMNMAPKIILDDLMLEKSEEVKLARHDSEKLQRCLEKCLEEL